MSDCDKRSRGAKKIQDRIHSCDILWFVFSSRRDIKEMAWRAVNIFSVFLAFIKIYWVKLRSFILLGEKLFATQMSSIFIINPLNESLYV